jgi:hypothetical protein
MKHGPEQSRGGDGGRSGRYLVMAALGAILIVATSGRTVSDLAVRTGDGPTARIVLACAEGRSNTAIAARLGISRNTVITVTAGTLPLG